VKTEESPIVEEVRRRSRELSARFQDDLRAYAEHLRGVEAKKFTRVVSQITVVKPSTDGRRSIPALAPLWMRRA
jgi:hypothetical protein